MNNNNETRLAEYEAPKATVLQFYVDANLMSGEPNTFDYDGSAPTNVDDWGLD